MFRVSYTFLFVVTSTGFTTFLLLHPPKFLRQGADRDDHNHRCDGNDVKVGSVSVGEQAATRYCRHGYVVVLPRGILVLSVIE